MGGMLLTPVVPLLRWSRSLRMRPRPFEGRNGVSSQGSRFVQGNRVATVAGGGSCHSGTGYRGCAISVVFACRAARITSGEWLDEPMDPLASLPPRTDSRVDRLEREIGWRRFARLDTHAADGHRHFQRI